VTIMELGQNKYLLLFNIHCFVRVDTKTEEYNKQ